MSKFMNKLSPKIITVWRAYLTLASLLPAFAISVRYAGSFAWKIAAGVFVLAFVWMYLFYLPALFKSFSYGVGDGTLVLKRGVFRERSIILPKAAIQSVAVGGEPLRLALKLADVTVFAAGASGRIPGLPLEEAWALAEELKPAWPEAQDR